MPISEIENTILEQAISNLGFNSSQILFLTDKAKSFEENEIIKRATDYGANAVYYLPELKSGQKAIVYFYDFTEINYSVNSLSKIAGIQQKIWNGNEVPLAFFIFKDSLKIVNCRKINESGEVDFLDELTAVQELPDFSLVLVLRSGMFWEIKEIQNQFGKENTVFEKCKEMIEKLINSFPINNELIAKKYVANLFLYFLRQSYAINQDFLENYFVFTKEEKEIIKNSNLPTFAKYVSETSNLIELQFLNFKFFSTELIGTILETVFAKNTPKESLFIPYQLHKSLLREALPDSLLFSISLENYKVLDSVGDSALSLFFTFQRLLQFDVFQNEGKSRDWESIIQNLAGIYENQYTKEILEICIRLELYKQGVIPFLDKNKLPISYVTTSFLELSCSENEKFDLILGNPWFLEKTNEELDNSWAIKNFEITIPKTSIAINYLVHSFRNLKPSGLTFMLLDSSNLLYRQLSEEFHEMLFIKHNVFQVFNLTLLSKSELIPRKETPISAFYIRNEKADCCHNLSHFTLQNNYSVSQNLHYENDSFDWHFINKQTEVYNPIIWKNDLLGGGEVRKICSKIKEQKTIKEILPIDFLEENSLDSFISLNKAFEFIINKLTFLKFDFSIIEKLKHQFENHTDIYEFYLLSSYPEYWKDSLDFKVDLIEKIPVFEDDFHLTENENKIIYESIEYYGTLQNKRKNKELFSFLNRKEMDKTILSYSSIFLEEINSLFSLPNQKFYLEKVYLIANSFIVTIFTYHKNEISTEFIEIDDFSSFLSPDSVQEIQRLFKRDKIIRLYPNQETIIFIKPNQKKYWISLAAYKDAAKYF